MPECEPAFGDRAYEGGSAGCLFSWRGRVPWAVSGQCRPLGPLHLAQHFLSDRLIIRTRADGSRHGGARASTAGVRTYPASVSVCMRSRSPRRPRSHVSRGAAPRGAGGQRSDGAALHCSRIPCQHHVGAGQGVVRPLPPRRRRR